MGGYTATEFARLAEGLRTQRRWVRCPKCNGPLRVTPEHRPNVHNGEQVLDDHEGLGTQVRGRYRRVPERQLRVHRAA